jgi:predicted MFS family arabinose efflux permease
VRFSAFVGQFRSQLRETSQSFRAVFANRQLRKLQLAFVGSITGEWGFLVALAVYANDQGGATAVSAVLVIRWVASALTAPWLAYFSDRYRRERVMLAADLSRAVAMLAMAAAAFAGASPVIVYVLAGFMAVASKTFRPAQAALLPLLAESPGELTAANATSTAIESVGTFVGPALGGLLLAVASVGWVFVADAVTLLWSAMFVVQLRSRREEATVATRERAGAFREMAAGFTALGSEREGRLIVSLYFGQTVVAGALRVLIVVTALDLLGVGNSGLGFLQAAMGVGGIIGVAIAFALIGRRRLASDFGLGLFLIGAGLGLIGVWPTFVGAILLIGVFGIGNTLVDVSGVTLLQRAVRDDVLGRVFGALESILVLGLAVGALIAPLLLDLIGTRATLIVVGAMLPILALLLSRRLRAIDERATVPTERIELLQANPIFAPLPPPAVEHLAMKLAPVTLARGETVFREGDHGDRFYVVEDGRCEIAIDGEKVRDAWPGEAFGEIALLRDVPRTATVTAVEPTTLLALERDDFIAAVTGHAPSREAADAMIGARLAAPLGIGSA